MDLNRVTGIYGFTRAHNRGRLDDILQTVKTALPLTTPQAGDEAVAAPPAAEACAPLGSTRTMATYSARLAALAGKGCAL